MLFHYRAKIEKNGIFSIPKEKQKEWGLQPGDFVEIQFDAPGKSIRPRHSIKGKYAGILSSEEFMRMKQEEIELEERKFQH